MTNFEINHDRSQTSSEKWNRQVLREQFGTDDVLPFWVADMDFDAPAAVLDCIRKRAERPLYSYEVHPEAMFSAAVEWNARRHDWQFSQSEICFSQSTLAAVALLLNQLTSEGDGVIVQPPVYFQFQAAIEQNRRTVVSNPLLLADGRYKMNFDDLETKAADPKTKILLLCNPHNPVGRVWKRGELQQVAEICLRHNVTVIADEVHGDFVFAGHSFTPFCSLSAEVAQASISCSSPAKTFNIPAITNSFVVISDASVRAEFLRHKERLFLDKINGFAAVATQAAYAEGQPWLDQAIEYVDQNARFLQDALRSRIPAVKLIRPESTFMAWLDFRAIDKPGSQLDEFLVKQARLALKTGHSFGPQGEGFARMAIGCSRTLIEQAVERLGKAISQA